MVPLLGHPENPITQVRQSAKRSNIPTVLSVEEIQRLFSSIKEPCRTAVILDAVSGLRVGELLGLKWEDVNFEKTRIKRYPLRFSAGYHSLQDGSFAQSHSHEHGDCGHALEMETGDSISTTRRLDFRQPAQSGNPTLLAWVAVQGAHKTGATESWHFCNIRK